MPDGDYRARRRETRSSNSSPRRLQSLRLRGKADITNPPDRRAFGLSEEVRRAHVRMSASASPMTFTHQMVRLLLVEQIYCAFKINRGEKYHW